MEEGDASSSPRKKTATLHPPHQVSWKIWVLPRIIAGLCLCLYQCQAFVASPASFLLIPGEYVAVFYYLGGYAYAATVQLQLISGRLHRGWDLFLGVSFVVQCATTTDQAYCLYTVLLLAQFTALGWEARRMLLQQEGLNRKKVGGNDDDILYYTGKDPPKDDAALNALRRREAAHRMEKTKRREFLSREAVKLAGEDTEYTDLPVV